MNWGEIAVIETRQISASDHGVRHQSRFVCIKLKNRPPAKNGWDAFFKKAKQAISGFDIILRESELSCTAESFMDECRKRMAAASQMQMQSGK